MKGQIKQGARERVRERVQREGAEREVSIEGGKGE
jgi:non-canonical (house-cleaning) NTP pyrophosphatase